MKMTRVRGDDRTVFAYEMARLARGDDAGVLMLVVMLQNAQMRIKGVSFAFYANIRHTHKRIQPDLAKWQEASFSQNTRLSCCKKPE